MSQSRKSVALAAIVAIAILSGITWNVALGGPLSPQGGTFVGSVTTGTVPVGTSATALGNSDLTDSAGTIGLGPNVTVTASTGDTNIIGAATLTVGGTLTADANVALNFLGGTTTADNLTLSGALSGGTGYVTSGPETMPGTTITVTDTGTVNDYNPTGISTANIIRANNASALTIDGIVGGTDGRGLTICDVGAANINVINEAAGSTAANRIWTSNAQNIVLIGTSNGNACASLLYDSTSSRWRVTGYLSTTILPATNYNSLLTAAAGSTVSAGQVTLSTATGHISTVGATVPVLSSCGTSPTIHGSDIAGRYTTGSAATTCTVTFGATYTNPPACSVHSEGTATQPTYTVSATAITVTVDIASTTYDYICIKVQ